MATFLTREGIVENLHRIIREASKELFLISPYIKVDNDTKKLLGETTRGTTIHVIFGKSQSRRNRNNVETSFDLPGIPVSFLKDLHAKCYLNEKEAIVTSMNLHEFSQEHNDEMGILVSRQEDSDLYDAIYQEASRLRDASGQLYADNTAKPKLKVAETQAKATYNAEQEPSRGFCIRCRATLAANPEQPYCLPCYKTWRRRSNPNYEDKYCHLCGQAFVATMREPVCSSCSEKYKDVFQFASR